MVARFEGQRLRIAVGAAAGSQRRIRRCRRPTRPAGAGVRQVGHRHEQLVQRLLQRAFFQLLQAHRHGLGLSHDGAGVLALGLELADLLGQRVAAGLQGFGLGLDGLAAGFQVVEPFRVEGHAAGLEAVDDGLQVFAQQYRVWVMSVRLRRASGRRPTVSWRVPGVQLAQESQLLLDLASSPRSVGR